MVPLATGNPDPVASARESLDLAVAASGLQAVDEAALPGQEPTFGAVPAQLDEAVRHRLEQQYPQGLYAHQSKAIAACLRGRDVCLATPTASGKSLVFMSVAAHRWRRDRQARVLALYPVRALIQDQLGKWRSFLQPLGAEPGFIDGGVPSYERLAILSRHPVVLMTPDVAHAWLMTNLHQEEVWTFLSHLELLVLDEAHVYDGVFGTNMAFFLRRFGLVAKVHQLICSTATVGDPEAFFRESRNDIVTVKNHRYTPKGLMYELAHPDPNITWMVEAESVQPLHGETELRWVNLVTGEERPRELGAGTEESGT